MNVRNGYCEKHDCYAHEMCAECHNEDIAELEAAKAALREEVGRLEGYKTDYLGVRSLCGLVDDDATVTDFIDGLFGRVEAAEAKAANLRDATCGKCGRSLAPDGDCHGCRADKLEVKIGEEGIPRMTMSKKLHEKINAQIVIERNDRAMYLCELAASAETDSGTVEFLYNIGAPYIIVRFPRVGDERPQYTVGAQDIYDAIMLARESKAEDPDVS